MSNTNAKFNDIELAMPLNPVYISTARTTASSIAEKMQFSNSKIEDIKTAVSETVNYLISNNSDRCSNTQFKIKFASVDNKLNVEFNSNIKGLSKSDEESMNFIKNCMDDVQISYDTNSLLKINMTKNI